MGSIMMVTSLVLVGHCKQILPRVYKYDTGKLYYDRYGRAYRPY